MMSATDKREPLTGGWRSGFIAKTALVTGAVGGGGWAQFAAPGGQRRDVAGGWGAAAGGPAVTTDAADRSGVRQLRSWSRCDRSDLGRTISN